MAFIAAAPASADSVPVVTGPTPSAVTFNSAHLAATVNPEGGPSATAWELQYSHEPAFEGWALAASGVFEGAEAEETTPLPVAGDATGLSPGTEYQVRLVASNEGGANVAISAEPNPTFTTTTVAPPTATALTISAITTTSAHFEATVNSGGSAPGEATEYRFHCAPECPGIEASQPATSDGADHTVEADATGLQPGAPYKLILTATNAGGEATAGPQTFTTTALAPTIESTGSGNLAATAATLTAQVVPGSTTATYHFEYGAEAGVYTASTPERTTPGPSTSAHTAGAIVTGLSPETSYHFRVVLTNTIETLAGPDQTLTTPAETTLPLQGHQFLPGPNNPITGTDTPAGGFNLPQGVAVDNSLSPSTGDIYITDFFNGVVDKLDSTGAYISQITPPPGTNGAAVPYAVAVDPNTGDLYITDTNNDQVDKYDSTGTLLYQIDGITPPGNPPGAIHSPEGVAVDNAGNVYIINFGTSGGATNDGAIDKFDSTGAYLSQITGLYEPSGIAVDNSTDPTDPSAGDLYIVDATSTLNPQVEKYSPAGTLLSLLDHNQPTAVTVDSSGHVVVDELNFVQEYEPSGAPFFQFGSGLLTYSEGIAYSNATGDVYATDHQGNNVHIFTPFTLTPPTPTVAAASNNARASAVLHATLNPQGLASTYRFAYVDAAHYNPAAPDPYSQGAVTPANTTSPGFEAIAIGVPVNGLQPNTTYHYALVASNKAGTATSADQTFTTGPAQPPGATTGAASGVTQSTATLSGSVNPDGLATSYRIELGTTTAYGIVAFGFAGSESADAPVTASFAGLAPATTYHYRVTATNADGTSQGADATFTTPAYPQGVAPLHNTGPARAVKPASKGCPKGKVKKKGKCVKKAHKKHGKNSAANKRG